MNESVRLSQIAKSDAVDRGIERVLTILGNIPARSCSSSGMEGISDQSRQAKRLPRWSFWSHPSGRWMTISIARISNIGRGIKNAFSLVDRAKTGVVLKEI
jgi:hypothetical protein